ncbi:MAG TPA: hypothetical protein VMH49_06650 [Thermoplasmata archaeon]|nr:hypothetical protein [Thermoplasmata archaeon]
MPRKPSPFPELRRRLAEIQDRAGRYQEEGLPIPTAQLESELEVAMRAGDVDRAEAIVKRAETLLARADQDWGWLRELLSRVDGLRAVADTVGLDLARIDARVGNPRAQLLGQPLTPTSIERAAAGASFALAVLNDAIPKYIVQEAQALGRSIRRARDRGEDVREAAATFAQLLRALQEPVLDAGAERLLETRRAVARIPRAPPVAAVSDEAEDEILSEARNLARRLHRIKTRAHQATDAVRLMSQVRQALSEERQERRYASPEEEVEALWAEVDRLTREKRLAGAVAGGGAELDESGEEDGEEGEPLGDEEEDLEDEEEAVAEPVRPVPAAGRATAVAPTTSSSTPPTPVPASRFPMPIVPPLTPVPDEAAGAPAPQSPDTLADGAGPRVPRPTRITIASAYVPPDLSTEEAPPETGSAPGSPRRQRSRHRD